MPNVPNFLPIVSSATALKAAAGALKKLKKLKIAKGLGKRKPRNFKAPSGRNFTVLQRSDIDWDMKRRVKVKGKVKIMTNRDAAKLHGRAPVVKVNGKKQPITLHHHNQNPNGPLIEVIQADHSKHHGALHPKGKSRIDRSEFGTDREAYWKARGADL